MARLSGQIGGWLAVIAAPLLAGLMLAASAQAASAAPREDFALGQSARSGAVCQAVRDFDDPLAAKAGLRAWQVMCRGWSQTLGRIYVFHSDGAAAQAWRTALGERATCEPGGNVPDPVLSKTTLATCKSKPLGVNYVAYEAHEGHDVIAAEGYAAIGDVLATGVKVALGRAPPPAATSRQTANLGSMLGGQIENLNAAAEASANSPAKQKESAYREAQQWQFGDAESRFSHLAETSLAGLGLADRAEAYLNVAINASNAGRYVEAEAYFKSAAPLVTEANSPPLSALASNIMAAHARNQRRFDDAISLAQQAIAVRRRSAGPAASGLVTMVGSDLTLGRAAAIALNAQGKIPSLQLSAEDREAVRDAQAWQIIGTCQEALDKRAEARQSLQAALDILNRPRGTDVLGSAAPWLVVRVQVDMAGLDREDGQPQLAVRRIDAALAIYEPLDPDSLPLGRYILELARAKAASGQEDAALADFERAFGIFQIKRGALGASADAAEAYFDILLKRIGGDPVTNAADAQRFFASSEALVGESTAAASLQFAERLSSEGTASAGISRARDATLRLVAQKDEEIRQLQRAGAYAGDVRTKADAELDDLRKQANELEQRLFDANPRYATALSTTVTSKDLHSELKDGYAYLKVMLLAGRGYGVLITRNRSAALRHRDEPRRGPAAGGAASRLDQRGLGGPARPVGRRRWRIRSTNHARSDRAADRQDSPPDLSARSDDDRHSDRRPGDRRRQRAAGGQEHRDGARGQDRGLLQGRELAGGAPGHLRLDLHRRLLEHAAHPPEQGRRALPGLRRPGHSQWPYRVQERGRAGLVDQHRRRRRLLRGVPQGADEAAPAAGGRFRGAVGGGGGGRAGQCDPGRGLH